MKIPGVTQSVADHLRNQIITGQLGPGARLNENELAEKFGVSRPPLREAFRKLEHENLMYSIPRKGAYVAVMSPRDCQQIYFARVAIECSALDLFESQDSRSLPLVEQAITDAAGLRSPDPGNTQEMLAYFELLSGFHTELVHSTENSWLIHFYRTLQSCLARYQLMYLTLPGSRDSSHQEHTEILEHISAGRYPMARQSLKRHIDRTLNLILAQIRAVREVVD